MNLKLHEVLSLYYELNGVTKQGQETEVLTQGMLKQKMSLKTKVYLQRLNKVVSEEVKLYEEAKQELWKKWGDEKDGMIEIPAEKVAAIAILIGLISIYVKVSLKLKELEIRVSVVEKQDDQISRKLDTIANQLNALSIQLQNKQDRE